jgi:hypothetical protein
MRLPKNLNAELRYGRAVLNYRLAIHENYGAGHVDFLSDDPSGANEPLVMTSERGG